MGALHLADSVYWESRGCTRPHSLPGRPLGPGSPAFQLPPAFHQAATTRTRVHGLHSSGGKAVGGFTWLTTYSLTVSPLGFVAFRPGSLIRRPPCAAPFEFLNLES